MRLPAGAPETSTLTRDEALAASPRVAIDTPGIKGSINLKGARIDDLVLKKYRETVDPSSPNVVLLSPSGSPHPYYVEHGWVADPGKDLARAGTRHACGRLSRPARSLHRSP